MNKQRNKNVDCEHCPDKCPAPLKGNISFLKFWNKVSRCFHYVGTMDGVYPVSLNWTDIETMARIHKVKLNSAMLSKLEIAQDKTMEEYNKKR